MPSVTGLEGVIAAETAISLVDGENGRLLYRGFEAKDLAIHYSFEEVAYLLLYGTLPSEEELEHFSLKLKKSRDIPDHIISIINLLPKDTGMMSVLRTAVSSLGDSSFDWKPDVNQAIQVIAIIPTIIAYRHHSINRTDFPKPKNTLDHVANYLYMLNGELPSSTHVKSLSTYMILTLEHGMNASTFSARAVLSTESDLISAITGAIGSMKGPLHGGAPSEVIAMLDEIGTIENTEEWLRSKLENKEKIMGFGHRIYKTHDPRSVALKKVSQELSGQDPWLDLALHVEEMSIRLLDEYKPGRKLYTNVEFYAAAVMRAVNMPAELFTPTFTASRVVGWTAHLLEQAENNRIFRPQSKYVGPTE
ncbi:citrate synthase/methylcitrate synthase [Bacillus luteolus]|uniref:Citrate synthase n=1 Tax=Litchfieldia luteola TaxID=682179 RepID=A0ABR9QEE1_9BACI|nr:citrate synthase/methylcitrate synthase [Cytobacillus luteolus]MBE4906859.1 citrate synthase/methylcitrate synthase [Cytobacillus luteolus]MBP1940486.1 citrate synthase [Cytobacillus luteolus]